MIIGVLADTHIPKRAKDLPPAAYDRLRNVDAIIHAGDVLTGDFLKKLEEVAPVYAVLGNNDYGVDLPITRELEFENIKIAIVHDSGSKEGRAKRLRKRFPDADVVIFGHSHIPLNQQEGDLLLFNPGSPTDKRRQEYATMGILHLTKGTARGEIVVLD